MAKAKYPGPESALASYEAAVAIVDELERKGAKNPYTSRNGHMFSFLDPDGHAALRLSTQDQASFCEQFESGPVLAYGKTMNGYVQVPDILLADADAFAQWLATSHEWIGTLKPKPTKKGT